MKSKREKHKTTEILRVQQNSNNEQRYVNIPKNSYIVKDDFVKVIKLEEEEEEKGWIRVK